jgi:inhibitor of cysteine peptidase
MTTRSIHLLAFLLVCVALASCASPAASVTKLAAKDAGSTVNVKVGNTLEIALEGNPTTGYTWEIAPESGTLLSQQGEAEFKPASSALGSGGIVTLRFKAVQPGKMKLKLIYHRTFEPGVAPLQSYEIGLVVEN